MLGVSRITVKGQVTIPQEFRAKLKLNAGDRVVFIENKEGDIVIKNAALVALENVSKGFEGVAEKLGINSEDEAIEYINDLRKGNNK